jgi:hypothetical protein
LVVFQESAHVKIRKTWNAELPMVVQQTYGGFLNFYPHLHTLASAGGLKLSSGSWIARLNFQKHEIMLAWRYVLLAYLDEAIKAGVLKTDLSKDELRKILEAEAERPWNLHRAPGVQKESGRSHRSLHSQASNCTEASKKNQR